MKNGECFDLSIIIPSKIFDQSSINCVNSVSDAINCYNELLEKEAKIEINIILKENDIVKAKKYFQGRKNITFLSQGGILKGESYARNIGIKNCRRKIIAFVDHDCIVASNWIKQIFLTFNKIKNDNKIVCILGRHWLYQKYSFWLKLYKKYRQDHATEHFKKEDNLIFTDRLDGRNFAILANVAKKFHFREDILSEQDREYGTQLIQNGFKILFNNEMIVYHESITLGMIIKRHYNYGIGSAKWRKAPKWFYRFYFFHLKRFLWGEITLSQTIFTMFCNFVFQLGRLSGNLTKYEK